MTLLDPAEARLRHIEADLTQIKADLAAIKARVDALPTRWMFWLFFASATIPIYGILVTLLWTTVHR